MNLSVLGQGWVTWGAWSRFTGPGGVTGLKGNIQVGQTSPCRLADKRSLVSARGQLQKGVVMTPGISY